jgi:hypothetical protein
MIDTRFDAELELVVGPARPPYLHTAFVRSRTLQRFDFRMSVQGPIGNAIDPVAAIANLAIRHVVQPRPKAATESAHDLFRSLQGYASYE